MVTVTRSLPESLVPGSPFKVSQSCHWSCHKYSPRSCLGRDTLYPEQGEFICPGSGGTQPIIEGMPDIVGGGGVLPPHWIVENQ